MKDINKPLKLTKEQGKKLINELLNPREPSPEALETYRRSIELNKKHKIFPENWL